MATLAKVRKKQTTRSKRARAADARKTARKTFGPSNKAGMKKWLKSPGRYDVVGVDTVGKGKATNNAKSKPKSKSKPKPTMSPAAARAYLAEFRKGGGIARRPRGMGPRSTKY